MVRWGVHWKRHRGRGARFFDGARVSQGSHMAKQETAGAASPERHTMPPGRPAAVLERGAEGQAAPTRAAGAPGADRPDGDPLAFTGRSQPGEASGIQWWEACGGWNVRYAMGTF